MAGHAEDDAVDTVFALERDRHRHGSGPRAPHMVDQLDDGMGGRQCRRSGLAQGDDLRAAGDSISHASRDALRREEIRERPALDTGARDDGRHLVAVAPERDGLDIAGGDIGGERERPAEAARVERTRHAQDPRARKARGAQHLRRHFVRGIGDDDDDGVGRMDADRLRRLDDDAAVRVKKIAAAHARRARTACGDDNNVRVTHEAEIGAANRARR
jgi:hypothetical protein